MKRRHLRKKKAEYVSKDFAISNTFVEICIPELQAKIQTGIDICSNSCAI